MRISLCDELMTSWCFRVCMYMMQFRNAMLLFLCCDFCLFVLFCFVFVLAVVVVFKDHTVISLLR